MKRSEFEETLWEMGSSDRLESGAVSEDAVLRAFRDGDLDEQEMRSVAALLARSADARVRLRALADVDDEPVPIEVRASFLEAISPPLPKRTEVVDAQFGWRRWRRIAAVAIVVLGVLLVWRLASPARLPPDLEYRVVATGIASIRSASAGIEPVEAVPDTWIRIEASPVRGAVEAVDIGLYAVRDGTIARLEQGPRLEHRVDRGSVIFAGRARDLMGPAPGLYTFLVVVAPRGNLPRVPRHLDEAEDPVESLVAGGQRLVYVQRIRLRPSSP